MEASPRDKCRSEAFDGGSLATVAGVMAEDILPNDPTECRRRNRLYVLRAMDRLGLLDESLIPTLVSRPDLRWLADEEGARLGILIELGRIRDPRSFEAAVGWVLENRPYTDEARAEIRRFRAGTIELPGTPGGRVGRPRSG
jgi:hypothetical protein